MGWMLLCKRRWSTPRHPLTRWLATIKTVMELRNLRMVSCRRVTGQLKAAETISSTHKPTHPQSWRLALQEDWPYGEEEDLDPAEYSSGHTTQRTTRVGHKDDRPVEDFLDMITHRQ